MLPFFHSFGFTVTSGSRWSPAAAWSTIPIRRTRKSIGELVAKYRGTFLLSHADLLRRLHPQVLAGGVRHAALVMVGRREAARAVAAAFQEKFGLDCSKATAAPRCRRWSRVNVPDFEAGKDTQIGNKPGTVGHPLPGVAVRVVDPATMRAAAAAIRKACCWSKGRTACWAISTSPSAPRRCRCDGWYVTGDIAAIDDDGFIRITDRLSRFSKIGGEMVPHMKVEEAVDAIVGDTPAR